MQHPLLILHDKQQQKKKKKLFEKVKSVFACLANVVQFT
jgi:hypothetical protein